jgi:hypothetical protein
MGIKQYQMKNHKEPISSFLFCDFVKLNYQSSFLVLKNKKKKTIFDK